MKNWEKQFREKFGRFYYSDTATMDWEKPKKQNTTGVMPNGHNGFCIASDDIEQFIKETLQSQREELLKEIEGTKKGKRSFSNRKFTYTDGYNKALQDIITKLK